MAAFCAPSAAIIAARESGFCAFPATGTSVTIAGAIDTLVALIIRRSSRMCEIENAPVA